MSSAAKTLDLLDHFSPVRPEIGLSQLCRLAKRDKATTYRHLQSLEEAGFLEQNPSSKEYRLGPRLLQLAQMREATVPRKAGVEGPLRTLVAATGETAHVTTLSGPSLYKLASLEPHQSVRVIVDLETFPLHATASGHCALAFGPDLFEAACNDLSAHTAKTPVTRGDLTTAIDRTRVAGLARSVGFLEDGVHSLAAPLFDETGFAGAISVASVASRVTAATETQTKAHLIAASREITRNWGGTVPDQVETAWATAPSILEPTP